MTPYILLFFGLVLDVLIVLALARVISFGSEGEGEE